MYSLDIGIQTQNVQNSRYTSTPLITQSGEDTAIKTAVQFFGWQLKNFIHLKSRFQCSLFSQGNQNQIVYIEIVF